MGMITARAGITAILILLTGAVPLYAQLLRAKAELRNEQGESVGTVVFEENAGEGVALQITITHLPPGVHSIHIHEQARCEPPGFTSAGEHFNPFDREHGFMNPQGPHAGDLPNFEVAKNGTADVRIYTKLVSLKPEALNSLFKPGGTSVVIHQSPDDYVTDPSGGGGSRIACGPVETIK